MDWAPLDVDWSGSYQSSCRTCAWSSAGVAACMTEAQIPTVTAAMTLAAATMALTAAAAVGDPTTKNVIVAMVVMTSATAGEAAASLTTTLARRVKEVPAESATEENSMGVPEDPAATRSLAAAEDGSKKSGEKNDGE
ncbi:hypothetical protein PR202_gb09843 [Eleusine coracana subsp. coracana]|uniref:Uncharacterized protein n=1 Tax=Eleusine coracana subsp. coracana TaxID=191504 RepID=A0AAV5EG02_ELECO|nr:hypothetical protein PR202_gb09843 [Eleusine coracana subsp. coracana]